MTVKIGTAIGQEVGSSVELFSVGGSKERSLQLSEELAAAGVLVKNADKGLFKDFTMAADNIGVFAGAKVDAANEATFAKPAKAVDFGQKFG